MVIWITVYCIQKENLLCLKVASNKTHLENFKKCKKHATIENSSSYTGLVQTYHLLTMRP